jgi:hypothetical protein
MYAFLNGVTAKAERIRAAYNRHATVVWCPHCGFSSQLAETCPKCGARWLSDEEVQRLEAEGDPVHGDSAENVLEIVPPVQTEGSPTEVELDDPPDQTAPGPVSETGPRRHFGVDQLTNAEILSLCNDLSEEEILIVLEEEKGGRSRVGAINYIEQALDAVRDE